MTRETTRDYSHLRRLLAEPALFDPDDMPVGQAYLRSRTKRALDIMLGLAISPVGLPAMALGATAVKLVDGSDPIFRQLRIGIDGQPFTLYKLRTMPGTPDNNFNSEDEPTHTLGTYEDSRRSKLGTFLSKFRIDEAPQLVNLAKGETSVVGPRPLPTPHMHQSRRYLGNKKHDEWMKVRSLGRTGQFDKFGVLFHGGLLEGEPDELLCARVDMESEYNLETASVMEDLRVLAGVATLLGQTVASHTVSATKNGLSRLKGIEEQV